MCSTKLFGKLKKLQINYSSASSIQNGNTRLKPWEEIPGPKSFPIIKQAYHFLPVVGTFRGMQMVEVGNYFHKNFGPIVRIDGVLGMKSLIMLFDPEAIALVLRSENSMPIRNGLETIEYYRKKHNRVDEEKRLTGLASEQGMRWKKFRSTVNPVMLQPKTIKLYDTVLNEVSSDMIQRIKLLKNENHMIANNFYEEITKWSLESIGTVALGGRIGCLDPTPPEKALRLIKCSGEIMRMLNKLENKPTFWKYYPTMNFRKAMNLYQEQDDLSKYFIDKARKEFTSIRNVDRQKSVLEKLLEIDERIALIMASDMLLGGVDTTATGIIGALYLLSTNKDKQEKLREEIRTSQNKGPYLKACLKEAFRVMPVVLGTLRETTVDYEILGYNVPKGVNVLFNHQYLSMVDEHYPNAKEFVPERWLVDKTDPIYYGNAHSFATSSFGFGTRTCIGRRIAQLEMEMFLSKLVENFHVEWIGPPPKVVNSLLNYIQAPYNFVFKDI